MMNVVKEKMALSASFFRNSIDAFHRRFVDIRITGKQSDSSLNHECAIALILTKAIRCSVKGGSKAKR